MRLRARVAWVVVGSLLAAATVHVAQPHSTAAGAVLLAAGAVLGELLVLRLADGTGLPLSYAVLLVLVTCFAPVAAAALVIGAELVAVVVRSTPRGIFARGVIAVQRIAVAAGALGAYREARHLIGSTDHLRDVLGALLAAFLAAVVVDELIRVVARRRSGLAGRGRMAWTALGSCALLMSVGYVGVRGHGDLGVWGPLLFSIPLLATWYSFERLDSINRTYRQTIEALAMAPELGGFVRPGHATRVAALASAIGHELDLDDAHLHDLETAALLHHLGQVTLDEPEPGTRVDAGRVTSVTAALLRDIAPLHAAAEIVAGEPVGVDSAWRRPVHRWSSPVDIASQALKVASDFDDLTEGSVSRAPAALEALYSSPGYVYDSRALEALERILDRDGRVRRSA